MYTTIYVKSQNTKFRSKIAKSLKHSKLKHGEDYIQGASTNNKHALYWLSPSTDLRTFKRAIGADLVWKYRLTFFEEIKLKHVDIKITEEEQKLIEEYRSLD